MSRTLIENFLAAVLLIHTSQSTRLIKHRTQPTCFAYIESRCNAVVGNRLDQLSY